MCLQCQVAPTADVHSFRFIAKSSVVVSIKQDTRYSLLHMMQLRRKGWISHLNELQASCWVNLNYMFTNITTAAHSWADITET